MVSQRTGNLVKEHLEWFTRYGFIGMLVSTEKIKYTLTKLDTVLPNSIHTYIT